MINDANRKKREAILVITDKGAKNLCRALAFKNRKIKMSAFGDAKDAVMNRQVDLILIDCSVDIEEGLKILRDNKSVRPGIPNIFITNISHKDLVLKVFRSGARDFFRKPFNTLELKNTVEGLLSVRQTSKETRCPFVNVSSCL